MQVNHPKPKLSLILSRFKALFRFHMKFLKKIEIAALRADPTS